VTVTQCCLLFQPHVLQPLHKVTTKSTHSAHIPLIPRIPDSASAAGGGRAKRPVLAPVPSAGHGTQQSGRYSRQSPRRDTVPMHGHGQAGAAAASPAVRQPAVCGGRGHCTSSPACCQKPAAAVLHAAKTLQQQQVSAVFPGVKTAPRHSPLHPSVVLVTSS